MGTPYSVIFERFLSKIEDYTLLQDILSEPGYANSLMLDYLNSSIPKFTYARDEIKVRDNETEQFECELSEREIEIIATLMQVEYLSPKILRSDTLENFLGSKDFETYSPANLLKETRITRENIINEAKALMVEYYYIERND